MPLHSSLARLDVGVLGLALEAERASVGAEPDAAMALYLDALEAQRRIDGEMPHALVGRLAALYRRCGRHDEEVALLRRYQEMHEFGSTAARYTARLSKALTLAERTRRTETIALHSVRLALVGRQVRPRPSARSS